MVVDHINKDVEIHAAHRLRQDTLAFACSESGLFGIDNVGGTEISGKCGAVFVLVLTLGAPFLKVKINFLPHCFTAGDGDETELAERGIVQYALFIFLDRFHRVCCPF